MPDEAAIVQSKLDTGYGAGTVTIFDPKLGCSVLMTPYFSV